jgi:hypothetical protein
LQYDAIPGDMVDASDYWPGSRNGDGNNRITTDADSGFSSGSENIIFFSHIFSANIMPMDNLFALGHPVLKIDEAKGMVAGRNIRSSSGSLHQLSEAAVQETHRAALYLNVGTPGASPGDRSNDSVGTLVASQAKTIDKKIDDGAARSGRFQAYRAWNSNQGNCLDGVDGDYLVSNDQPACMGAYILE